ncbi:ImmA/IrrE family metallo-endopeptidase [Lacticaseibacillus zeae]|uniref:ImmA/IrrE family metallo-endopeptidase n=1 Tax=Lacticaseibacillus zeae TaxID=57037 RepID=A0A5R8LUZ9_LACZE|nr:ImmA/IrrE family metallo-endopeptidase [Lacticaseibacillus zeae]TLF41000.1 ImmA/IrrE family metallo-endopeptidase [Lacticaseibacillus zeae]
MNEVALEILNRVMQFAFDHGISVEFARMDREQTPVVNTIRKLIILNSDWPNKNKFPFQAAHELGHILNGDRGQFHYIPRLFRSGVESRANQTALSLIVPMYFDEIDTENANVDKFMEDLAVPIEAKDDGINAIRAFYFDD